MRELQELREQEELRELKEFNDLKKNSALKELKMKTTENTTAKKIPDTRELGEFSK